ncbi:amiloride-sensitive sodium channel subunit alpha-like [Ornithodoros turicata]|uniref:amiloride-sensitive sodium channel subunit alpha-like n=1 Tax=Ornithodoros turicata TaxID=34597 RepID=UPI0031391A8B
MRVYLQEFITNYRYFSMSPVYLDSTYNELGRWISAEQRRNFSRANHLGHQLEDMIKECKLSSGDCLGAGLLELRMVPRYGNCYCLGCNASRFSWWAKAMPDPSSGLTMSLNMEPEEYLPVITDAGFYVMVHQPGIQEEVTDNSLFVPPGYTSYIGINLSMLHKLRSPYENPCQSEWPVEFHRYLVRGLIYTRRACLEYCYQVHVFETSGCRSYSHIASMSPRSPMLPSCHDVLKDECEQMIEDQIARGSITCQVSPSCL